MSVLALPSVLHGERTSCARGVGWARKEEDKSKGLVCHGKGDDSRGWEVCQQKVIAPEGSAEFCGWVSGSRPRSLSVGGGRYFRGDQDLDMPGSISYYLATAKYWIMVSKKIISPYQAASQDVKR